MHIHFIYFGYFIHLFRIFAADETYSSALVLKQKNDKMKRQLLFMSLLLMVLTGAAQTNFSISHGPYLQEVTGDGATFVFLTSEKSFSSIELKKSGSDEAVLYYHTRHGLRDAYNTFHSIRVENLVPGDSYQYRIRSKEICSFEPYKVTFGDSIASQWYTFKTLDPKSKGGSIFITSDMHDDAKKLETLLNLCDYKTCDAFFYAGDIMSYMVTEETPFKSFVDTSVNMFATSIPFELVRGNHETRGKMARVYPDLFPKKDGKIYGSYLMGDIMVVMIDCGEDKPDTHWVYAGLTNFDDYRTEQAEWLRQLVKTKEFKNAKYRLVVSHFPMVNGVYDYKEEGHGMNDLARKCLPILNKANIDLMVSGHTHEYAFHERNVGGNNFPVLVGSNESATRLDIANGKVKVKVVDKKGTILLDTTL